MSSLIRDIPKFSRRFWWAVAMLGLFAITFAIYVQSEKQIDRANELRLRSFLLSDELRHTSDDLTRMVRSYVITGDRRYKTYFEEILAIRDGRSPRPSSYSRIYWDQILAKPERAAAEGSTVPLLQLMREAGFTREELALLEKAKSLSDDLTRTERAAMQWVESAEAPDAATRLKASLLLQDAAYHGAKAAIMGSIHDFDRLMDHRTRQAVLSAERTASMVRVILMLCGALLITSLWYAYRSLRSTLGAPVDMIYGHIAKLGRGEFSDPTAEPGSARDSIMAWLAETQSKLARLDRERHSAQTQSQRMAQLYATLSQCNQAIVRSGSEQELFDAICRDAVFHGGMRTACVGMLDPTGTRLRLIATYGEGAESLPEGDFPVGPDAPRNPTSLAIAEDRPCWSQDLYSGLDPEHCCDSAAGCAWGSCAALPLHRGGRVVGAMSLYSTDTAAFDEQERALLMEMAADLDFALDNFAREEQRRQAQSELAESRNLLQTVIDTAPVRIFWKDLRSRYLGANPAFARDAGFADPKDLIGLDDHQMIWREQASQYRADDRQVMEFGVPKLFFEVQQVTPDGKTICCLTSKVPLRNAKGETVGVLGIYQDITVQKRTENALLRSQTYLNRAQSVAKIGSWYVDLKRDELEWSDETYRMFGLRRDAPLTLQTFLERVHPQDREAVTAAWESSLQGLPYHIEHRIVVDGETRWVEERAELEYDENGDCTIAVGTVQDITERKHNEERINFLANYDALTGLPNRVQLDDHLRYALSLAKRSNGSLALMFLDLDHFKDINDTLGHSVGDAVLVELAQRLRASLRLEDTISRLGGDEFILLLPGTNALGASQVAEKLLQAIAEDFRIGPYRLRLTASIGIALYPEDGLSLETLFKNADTAMYRAKHEGRHGYRFFTQEMQARAARNLSVVNGLRTALENEELRLYFQPQVSLSDQSILCVEALLRWEHPELGPVSPGEFIPVAEESGLILGIGQWVLRQAVRQAKAWLAGDFSPMALSVNLSFAQLRHGDLAELVMGILQEEGLPPQYLELELTEGVAMGNPQASVAVMDRLNELGVRLSIDDFGTGYSSLSYLKKFKIYKLKIDQSFVRDIDTDPDDKAIVGTIIHMAKRLGLQTIAEGVETAEQLEYLREQGCDGVQGYYYSNPLAAEQLEAFIKARA